MKPRKSKSSSVTETEFRADLLLQSLRGHADHLGGKKQLTMRVTRIVPPGRVKALYQVKE